MQPCSRCREGFTATEPKQRMCVKCMIIDLHQLEEELEESITENRNKDERCLGYMVEIERLKSAFGKYARHDRNCYSNKDWPDVCVCGFSDVLSLGD